MLSINTKNILSLFIVFLLFIILNACEKEIDITLPDTKPKLVIEGIIENGEYAYVTLTKSSPYFTSVDSTSFEKLFISDALVIVSNGIETDTLKFDTVPFYPPLRFQGQKIKGEINNTYSLRIEYENEVYTANTKILEPVPIDSVKYQFRTNSDSLGYLRIYSIDPVNQTNYYRIFTLDLDIDLTKEIPIWVHRNNSVFDDRFFNGKLIENTIFKGRNPLKSPDYYEENSEDWWAFKMDDEVIVKLSQLDYQSFVFWRTTEQVINTGDNPFAAPTSVQSNIKQNALGVWCGYASSIEHIIISEDLLIP